jgi:hypothetical protein
MTEKQLAEFTSKRAALQGLLRFLRANAPRPRRGGGIVYIERERPVSKQTDDKA